MPVSNYKYVEFDFVNSNAAVSRVAENSLIAKQHYLPVTPNNYNFRWYATQYQTCHIKSCSEWISYFSNFSEIWSFFLIFYFVALSFFFFYIIPESIATNRLAINSATPKSWISGTIACGVPFTLIFGMLYESIFMLFTNETYNGRVLPLFLIEGRQWKWEYRYNLAAIVEQTASYKTLGSGTNVSAYHLQNNEVRFIMSKYTVLLGFEFTEAALRVKSELLKSTRAAPAIRDILTVLNPVFASKVSYPQLSSTFSEFFSKFRITESTRRLLTATKSIILPDTYFVRAQITSADVIHSWTIPGLGVRIDAVPGKLYALKIPFKYYGIFSGQCSEVCGLRHAYMPISINFTTYAFFIKSIYLTFFSNVDLFFYRFYIKSV